MRIDFPYPGYERIAAVEVLTRICWGVYTPRTAGIVDEEAVLTHGFAYPTVRRACARRLLAVIAC